MPDAPALQYRGGQIRLDFLSNARPYMARLTVAMIRGPSIGGKHVLPASAIDGFRLHLTANAYSRHTRRAYLCDLLGLARFCGERRVCLKSVSASDLAEFLNSPHARVGPTGHQRAPGALNRVRASLRAFFRWLRETGQIGVNPAVALRAGAFYPEPPATINRQDEGRLLSALRSAAGPLAFRDGVMVEMLLATGIRIGELVGLDRDDVDLEAATAIIKAKGGPVQVRHMRADSTPWYSAEIRYRHDPEWGAVPATVTLRGTGNRGAELASTIVLVVTEFLPNPPLGPEAFRIDFPPATEVLDMFTGKRYTVPGSPGSTTGGGPTLPD